MRRSARFAVIARISAAPWLALLAVLVHALTFAASAIAQADTVSVATASGSDEPDPMGVPMLFGYVVFPVLLLLHRLIVVWWVRRGMYGQSGAALPEAGDGTDQPTRPAGAELQFIELDANTLPEAGALREVVVDQAMGELRQRRRIALYGAAATLLLPALISWIAREPFNEAAQAVMFFAVVYAILVTLSFGSHRNGFYAHGNISGALWNFYVNVVRWFIRIWLRPGYDIAGWLFYAAVLAGMAGSWGQENGSPAGPIFQGILWLVLAAHGALLVRALRVRDAPPANIKLLVLRVFGSSGGAYLTFDRLIEPWRNFGVHFTVDDPNFARHRYGMFQKRTLFIFFLVFFAAAASVWVAFAIFCIVVALDWRGLVERRPVETPEAAQARIQRVVAEPRDFFGQFRDARMVCYMNTWKQVVAQFVGHADVVLFDLREFSAKNGGSTWEINFLFDRFPLSNILFLRDRKSDSEAIYHAIRQQWHELLESSPNLDLPEPAALVYVIERENDANVQGLIDAVLAVASLDHNAPPDEEPAALDASKTDSAPGEAPAAA